jgi:putative sugar O-methyltransferase
MNALLRDATSLASRAFWGGLRRGFGVRRGRVYRWLGKGKLSPEQEDLLAQMRRDNAAAREPYRATEFWVRENERFDDLFQLEGIGDVESQAINLRFSGFPPSRLLHYSAWMLYKDIAARDRFGLLSRMRGAPAVESGLGFRFGDHHVSWDQLISIDTLYSIAEVHEGLFRDPVVVVDLGSGWGRIGYVLKSVNPRSVYVACDLPEGLLVSSTLLARRLPGEAMHFYPENRSVSEFTRDRLLNDGGVRFIGPQDLDRFADESVDVFINVASFQEMTRDQVAMYFRVIDAKTRGIVYLQEYWDGARMGHVGSEIAGHAAYPFLPSWRECFTRNATFSDLYFESAHRVR